MLLHIEKAGVISSHELAGTAPIPRGSLRCTAPNIAGMERTLAEKGGNRFVPLPTWRPTNSIPDDFMVVLGSRPPLANQNPAVPVLAEF